MTTAYDPRTIWLIILAAGLGTYVLRLSFVLLFGRIRQLPPTVEGLLRFVPAAVLAALVVPAVVSLSLTPAPALSFRTGRVLAAVIAALVAWRTGNVLATIGVGMAALWGFGALG